jgi:hypothetical protein
VVPTVFNTSPNSTSAGGRTTDRLAYRVLFDPAMGVEEVADHGEVLRRQFILVIRSDVRSGWA